MTDRSAFDPFSPPPAAPVELTERAAETFAIGGIVTNTPLLNDGIGGHETVIPLEPTHAEHVAFIASELEAGLARKGIDV